MDAAKKTSLNFPQNESIFIQHQLVRYRLSPSFQQEKKKKASMPDAYINSEASKAAVEKRKNSIVNKFQKGILLGALPIAYSIADGAVTPADSIAKKLGNTLKTAKGCGVAIAALFGAYKGLDYVTRKAPVLKDFREESPGLTTVGIVAGTAGAAWASNTVVNTISSKIGKTNFVNENIVKPAQKQLLKIDEKINKHKAAEVIDNKIYKPMNSFFKEKAAGKIVKTWAIPLTIGAVVLKFVDDLHSISKNKTQIAEELKQERKQSQLLVSSSKTYA